MNPFVTVMDQKEFCKYCDCGYNGFNTCENAGYYSGRGWCGWSTIEGVRVLTEAETITNTATGDVVDRADTAGLRKLIDAWKAAGRNVERTPKKSPFEKAVKK